MKEPKPSFWVSLLFWKEGYQAVCMYSRACQFHGSSSDSQAQKPCAPQKIPWCVCSVPAAVGSFGKPFTLDGLGFTPFLTRLQCTSKGSVTLSREVHAKAMMMVCARRPAPAAKAHRGFSHRRMAEGTHTHTHRLTRQRKPFPSIFRHTSRWAGLVL